MTDLTPLLSEPDASIAVVGATDTPRKYGGIIYRDLKKKGFTVYPVNPHRDTVDGDRCYPSVDVLPVTPTIVDLVVPAREGMEVLDDCVKAGALNVWVQPGAESRALLDKLEQGPFTWLAHACIMVRARV